MYVVCRVDPYDENRIYELTACFEHAVDAEKMAKYMNLLDIYTKIVAYKKEPNCVDRIEHLKNIVEQDRGINHPYESYIVVDVPCMTNAEIGDIDALKNIIMREV